ncbi:FAR1-related sequence 5-like protein [Tanacetum coccineum]
MKKHEIEHIHSLTTRYNGFRELYKEWIKSDTIEEFKARWEVLCTSYNLESNKWIQELYDQRFHLAKAFFVVQYDKAFECRRAAEEDEDFKTINSRAVLYFVNPIEAKAGARYTIKMFEIFQKEWIEATNNLTHETLNKSPEVFKYKVSDRGTYLVRSMLSDCYLSCCFYMSWLLLMWYNGGYLTIRGSLFSGLAGRIMNNEGFWDDEGDLEVVSHIVVDIACTCKMYQNPMEGQSGTNNSMVYCCDWSMDPIMAMNVVTGCGDVGDQFGMLARVSHELGARNPQAVKTALLVASTLGAVEVIIAITTLLCSRSVLGYAFGNEEELVNYVKDITLLLCFTMFTDSIQAILQGSVFYLNSVKMHHESLLKALPRDNVCFNVNNVAVKECGEGSGAHWWQRVEKVVVGRRRYDGGRDVHNETELNALTIWCVHENFSKATEQAKDSSSEIKKLNNMLVKQFEEQNIRKKATESQNTLPHSNVVTSQVDLIPQISVRDPEVPNTNKGRPKVAIRNKNPLEEPKKRTSYYGKKGHYIIGCPKNKADDVTLENQG